MFHSKLLRVDHGQDIRLLTTMAAQKTSLIDPAVFQGLQSKIDDDTQARERLKDIIQDLEKHGDIQTSSE